MTEDTKEYIWCKEPWLCAKDRTGTYRLIAGWKITENNECEAIFVGDDMPTTSD